MQLFRGVAAPAAVAFIAGILAHAQAPPAIEALDGLDPVLLVQGKETSGKADLRVVRGRYAYLFSSSDTKATFERDPAAYEIQLGGLCAKMGRTAMGNPADFIVHEGRIYIFGSDDCHDKFKAAPAKYLSKPPTPMPSSPQVVRRGRDLVEKVVAATGGARRLDALTSYVEHASQTVVRPMGPVNVDLKTMWQFPASVRVERTMKMADRSMTSATVVTPLGAWFIGQNRPFPINPAGRPSLDQDLLRHPVALLRARHDPEFQAVALGPGSVDGTQVERVRVRFHAMDVTMNVNRSTSALHSLTFTDRNMEARSGSTW
jgi:YHS domain-containing protein